MIGQPQSHRRRAVVIVMHTIGKRQPQGPMSPMEVVIEQLQAYERIPSVIAFGEGMCLTGESIEPITQGAVESFDMHGARWLHQHPQRRAGLHRQQSSVLITMLDGLRQGDRLWDHQPGTPPFARYHALAIGPLQDAPLAVPAITEPMQLALLSALNCGDHRLLDQRLA
jgi:hypothetical protein